MSELIRSGEHVAARTATNDWITFRAVTGIEKGTDFPVVWVCSEADWEEARKGNHRVSIPWPADEVVAVDGEEPS